MTANGCGSSQARADLLGGQPKKVLSHTVPSIFSILMDAVSFEPMSTPALLWPMAACCSQGYLCVVSKLQDMLLHNCHCCAQGQQGRHTDTHTTIFLCLNFAYNHKPMQACVMHFAIIVHVIYACLYNIDRTSVNLSKGLKAHPHQVYFWAWKHSSGAIVFEVAKICS